MAEDKWVSLGLFHPYEWSYFTPPISGFWLVAASNLSFRNHETRMVDWWLSLQNVPSFGWSKNGWLEASICWSNPTTLWKPPAGLRFATLRCERKKANQQYWLPKWWERHDGDLNPMVNSVKNHLKNKSEEQETPCRVFSVFSCRFPYPLQFVWCPLECVVATVRRHSWPGATTPKTGDMLFFLAGGGWGKVVSWSSNHHRHDKRGMIFESWIWHSSMESEWQMWRSTYPDLKKRNLRKKPESQSPVVTSPPKITTLTISSQSPFKFWCWSFTKSWLIHVTGATCFIWDFPPPPKKKQALHVSSLSFWRLHQAKVPPCPDSQPSHSSMVKFETASSWRHISQWKWPRLSLSEFMISCNSTHGPRKKKHSYSYFPWSTGWDPYNGSLIIPT